jgi:hypothetical protein
MITISLVISMGISGIADARSSDFDFENFERFIVENFDESKMDFFKGRGCILKHIIGDSVSFDCPSDSEGFLKSLSSIMVRQSRVLRIVDLGSDQQTGADLVWADGVTGNGVSVAILDTGIVTSHSELMDNYLGGYDFVNNDPVPDDDHGHGTHVAGIITSNGAHDLNSKGSAPSAGIYMYKVCDSSGNCYEDDMMAAMDAAVQVGADVMSISIGGDVYITENCDSDPLAAKINWVVDQGLTAVIAAGNNGKGVSSPGCASGAIAVGAVDTNNNVPYWSGRGSALDITAPGVSIYSTHLHGGYGYMSGTSMATPHVAGIVALLLETDPIMTTNEIKTVLYNAADHVNKCYGCSWYSWWGTCYGFGQIPCTSSIVGSGVVDAHEAYLTIKPNGTVPPEPDDTDGDGIPDPEDACLTTYGTYCNGCPESECTGCQSAQCSVEGQPYCLDDNDMCTLSNADGICISGECSFECYSGYSNCNDDWNDGCETNIVSDSSNCGGCDNSCGEVICPDSGCGVGECGADEYGTYSVTQQSNCFDGSCTGECGVTCEYDILCDLDDDDDGVADTGDACPETYGTHCNGCPDPCSGCVISSCPLTGPPICNAASGSCSSTVCPGDGCGVGTCQANEYGTHTIAVNRCVLDGNVGICTENPCTLHCVYDQACEPEPPPGLCWDGDNQYIIRNSNQFRKFCSCAEGMYSYTTYGYAWGKLTAYQYVDSGNNDNWQTGSASYYFPAYRIKCADGNWYDLNQDY